MTNNSIKLAQLWTNLRSVKDRLDNEIIPVAGYLVLEDPDLMLALETLSGAIENHFEQFKLVAEIRR